MALKYWLAGGFVALMLGSASGQAPLADTAGSTPAKWRSPSKGVAPTALRTATAPTTPPATPIATPSVPSPVAKMPTPKSETIPSATRVTKGSGQLPSDHGQVWREYDISPYTSKVTTTEKPEQAIVDWILRETGTDTWFTGEICLLNADRNTLRVYHTPQMQRSVADIVDRFVVSQAETYNIGLRLSTVGSPNWRAKFHTMLRPVTVQSPGVEAWLVSKENAAFLLGELRKRTDYREQNSSGANIQNGQSQTIAQTRLKSYTRGVRLREAYPFYELENGQIDEGYSLQVSPLFSADGSSLDLVLKCHIDQLEKLVPVAMEVPAGGSVQRVNIQVPQLVSWRLHERFRWPADQVLLLSCGVVASPTGEKAAPLGLPGLSGLSTAPGRADALLFIESHGQVDAAVVEAARAGGASPMVLRTGTRY